MQKIRLKIFLMLIGFACGVEAGPLSKLHNPVDNSVDEAHSDLLAFTRKHIAEQQNKVNKSCLNELLWKYKYPEKYIKKDSIIYGDLNKDIKILILEFAELEIPLIKPKDKDYVLPDRSPLQDAIFSRDFNRVRLLIALGADVNTTRSRSGITPLFLAMKQYEFTYKHQYIEQIVSYGIFKYLLMHDADCNKPNDKSKDFLNPGETPLDKAVEYSRYESVFLEDLLKLPNINLHAKNKYNRTALDEARKSAMAKCTNLYFRKRYYKICTLLEQAGASSSVVLEPMPSDEAMGYQLRDALSRMPSDEAMSYQHSDAISRMESDEFFWWECLYNYV